MTVDIKNNDPFLPFAAPDIGEEEIDGVVECLRSGWLTTGPKTKAFETEFAAFLGGDVEAIAVNSASAGLHLGLEALGVGPGDEVITTTHTFTATAEVIRYLGAAPVLVDIAPDTLCIDPDAVERALTEQTKVIIPVHFGGLAADMTHLSTLAAQYGIKIMEDAAHALPATSNNRLVGSLDRDVTVFSFYANKTITTGEGGMIVTRDPDLAKRVRVMRLHGISRDAFDRFTSNKPSGHYEVIAPGYKYNLTDIASAIGSAQLKPAYDFQNKRQAIAQHYGRGLGSHPLRLPVSAQGNDIHSWHLYLIQLLPECRIGRNQFIDELCQRGIGCSVHYIPLHQYPYWRDRYDLTTDMFSVSQNVHENCISLPMHTKMSDSYTDRVIEAVRDPSKLPSENRSASRFRINSYVEFQNYETRH